LRGVPAHAAKMPLPSLHFQHTRISPANSLRSRPGYRSPSLYGSIADFTAGAIQHSGSGPVQIPRPPGVNRIVFLTLVVSRCCDIVQPNSDADERRHICPTKLTVNGRFNLFREPSYHHRKNAFRYFYCCPTGLRSAKRRRRFCSLVSVCP